MRRSGLILALSCGLTWLYADVARDLLTQWIASPDAAYGAILAGVAAFLFWQDRHRLAARASLSTRSLSGFIVVATGLALYLAGIFSTDLYTTRVSFVVVLGGLIWFIVGSMAARVAVTPLFFLLLSIPLPELIVTSLTSSLQTVASHIAEMTLAAASIPVYRDGNVLELPSTTLQVVEACSGLRSVVSLASVGVLLAWATPGPRLRRTGILLATVPIAVLINGLRIAGTGVAAETWGPALTRDPWHSIAGWITFVVSLLALWVVRRALLRPPATPVSCPAAQVVHS